MNFKRIKNLGLVLICYALLTRCCKELGAETGLFQRAAKHSLNNIISLMEKVIRASQTLSNIRDTQKAFNKEIEIADVNHEIQTQTEIIELLYDLMIDKNAIELYDLVTYLDAYKRGEKLYTEKEMEMLITKNC